MTRDDIPKGPNNGKKQKFETLQLHVGQEQPDPVTSSRAVPIYLTTSYVFDNSQHAADRFGLRDAGNIYGRLTNSTQDVLEKRIAALEGGSAALAVATGAAAITYSILNLAEAGDNIVSAKTIYGGSYNLFEHTLPRYGIGTTFVDPDEEGAFESAIDDRTKALFVETLGNPNSNIIDIEAVSEVAHRHGIPLVVDNTFATPYLFRPLEHGADVVVESATKFIGGHGTVLGGVIVEGGNFDWGNGKFPGLSEPDVSYHGVSFYQALGPAAFVTRIRAVLLRDTGATISPVTAFVLIQGLETLSLRVERHVENTLKVIEYLRSNQKVASISHPSLPDHPSHALYERYFPDGAGSIFTIEVNGTEEDAKRFIDSLELFSLLANVADVKSLVIHPASTTHSQLSEEELREQGITPSTVRLSIGTEHIDDIIADLDQAFARIPSGSARAREDVDMGDDRQVYMDSASTSAVRPEVLEAMLPYFTEHFGNPASIHSAGRSPREAVERARAHLASLIGAKPEEIYLTSGGSESDNWALKSAVLGPHAKGRHLIVSSIEHHAIINTCGYLEKLGYEVTYLPVDCYGLVDPADVEAAIRPDTAIVSVMTANNEIGTIEPVREIGELCRRRGVLFHTDAVQAYGQVDIDVGRDRIDLLTASAHKIGGPKGVGFLYIRNGVCLDPLIHGGEQERGIRGGTTNVPGAVGFGRAVELAAADMDARVSAEARLRDRLVERVLAEIPHSRLNGHPIRRLPNNANFSFDFVEGESLLMSLNMRGICASTGSACASGSLDPSHVLLAIGLEHQTAHGSLRFSVPPTATTEDVDYAVEVLKDAVARIRSLSPLYDDFLRKGGRRCTTASTATR